MARWVVPWLALLVLGAAVAASAGVTATLDRGQASEPALGATQTDFDSTEFDITVYGNGSARWTFKYKKRLNETERQNFEEFAAKFNNQSDPELFVNFKRRAESLTSQGTNATGRTMEARDFSKRAFVTQLGSQGVVRMSFTWTNFGATEGEKVIVGDVFEGGLYIGPNQRLVFHPGPDVIFAEVSPDPEIKDGDTLRASETIAWEGPRDFVSGPTVTFAPPSAVNSPDNGGPGGPSGGTFGQFGVLPWVALALVVLVGLAGGFAYRSGSLRRFGVGGPGGPGGPGGAGGTDGASGGGGPGGAEATGGAGGATTASSTGGAAEPAVSDEELLSDEDRVMQLLEESGGRMKQVNIVDETGWSKSKVSMLLSEMEDEDHISKLRVGRENIISLKGEEPEAAGSPFEQETED